MRENLQGLGYTWHIKAQDKAEGRSAIASMLHCLIYRSDACWKRMHADCVRYRFLRSIWLSWGRVYLRLPSRDAHDLREGSSRPKYKNSIMAITIGQDALKQIIVSTGTYCITHIDCLFHQGRATVATDIKHVTVS